MDHKGALIGFIGALVLAAVICFGFFNVDITGFIPDDLLEESGPVFNTAATGDLWYDIYFTDPTCPPEAERHDGLDGIIAADIRDAELAVDIAAFDLDSQPLIDALIDREAAGLSVRAVVDDEHTPEATVNRLRRNGISVVEDRRAALMHNKFIVIDGRYLWTGSLNYTSNGAFCNNNNAVRLDAPELAANYRAEFEEMFDDRAFGPRSPHDAAVEKLTIRGIAIENYFAPEKEVAPVIVDALYQAESDIRFLAFSLTEENIGAALLARAADGVAIWGVFEATGSESAFSYRNTLNDAGLPNIQVVTDGNPRLMHHKVILIDDHTTIFGSFNFSAAANDNNDENVLIIHDPQFTSFFLEEFDTIWNEALNP